MHRTHIHDLPWEEQRSPGGKFRSFHRNLSVALGGVRNGGTWCGGHPFDLQIRRVPPGAAVCPLHLHLAQWEMFVVQAGVGTVRTMEGRHAIAAGDVFLHPPGAAHQLINTGSSDLEVLIIADNQPLDACFYPDSDKWALRPPVRFFRITETGYFDGEEPPVPGAPPYQPSGCPPTPVVAPFGERRLRIDALPWDDWSSPKGRFRGSSKELSIALGAKRNTPAGLGGHPFDLELQKLAPHTCGCPLHSHAAQWELFLILSGTATVRLADDRHRLHAGDVVLHRPGELHQISNDGDDELQFFLVADNPPVDFCQYPDSDKWGFLRNPRKFFRAAEIDYWAGEE